MKKLIYSLLLIVLGSPAVNAQVAPDTIRFAFASIVDTYTPLSPAAVPIPIDAATDVSAAIVLPFNFRYLTEPVDTFWVEAYSGALYFKNPEENPFSIIGCSGEYATLPSYVISSEVVGAPGNKIAKFEFRNAAVVDDSGHVFSNNFQLWLHEDNNEISVHFGSNDIPDSVITDVVGGFITGLLYTAGDTIPLDETFASAQLINNLTGSYADTAFSIADLDGSSVPYEAISYNKLPSAGTVFRFVPIPPTTPSGILPIAGFKDVVISPNPSKDGIFSISYAANAKTATALTVYNSLGRQVLMQTKIGSNSIIDLGQQAAGTYVAVITIDSKQYSAKLVKQ